MPAPTALTGREVWFLTGSQRLYGEETLRQVAAQSAGHRRRAGRRPGHPGPDRVEAGAHRPDEIRRLILEANEDDAVLGVIAWMHTFSPAKMWIAGLTALGKPLLHLHTQANVALPWADIDFDFMNLNQAAHGDREFGYIQTRLALRRKTVVGHVSDPRVIAQVATWAGPPPAGPRPDRSSSPGSATTCASSPSPRATRPRPRPSSAFQVNTWGVNDLAAAVGRCPRSRGRRPRGRVPGHLRRRGRTAAREGSAPVAARRRGHRARPALVPDAGGFGAFTTNFEDLGALKQLPGLAVQRLMADGYGFGAEGDWKTAMLVRAAKVMGAGLPGGASLMEDYTYDLTPGPASASSARTCSRSVPA
jgi:L-arabinose isomerase